jgi:hypothetical protein
MPRGGRFRIDDTFLDFGDLARLYRLLEII